MKKASVKWYSEVNGNRRTVSIKDQGAKAQAAAASVVMADPDNEKEIGANIPGTILKVLVKEGPKSGSKPTNRCY